MYNLYRKMEVNMEDEVLSTKIVEPLLRITESNYRLFKELCVCEKNGKMNSEEYKKKLDYLSIVKEEEEKFYQSISNNISLCRDAAFYIISNKLPDSIFRDFDSVIIDKHDFASIRRIINYLNQFISSSSLSFKRSPFMNEEENKQMLNSYFDFNYLLNAIQNDFINTFLYNISERIKFESDKGIRDLLIKAKYYTAFIFPGSSLEVIFSDNANGVFCVTDYILKYCNDFDDNYSKIKNSFLVRNAKQYIMKMLLINESGISANSIILEEMVRSFIELMSLDEMDEVYNYFNYFSSNKNIDLKVIQRVDNLFASICEEKKKFLSIKM